MTSGNRGRKRELLGENDYRGGGKKSRMEEEERGEEESEYKQDNIPTNCRSKFVSRSAKSYCNAEPVSDTKSNYMGLEDMVCGEKEKERRRGAASSSGGGGGGRREQITLGGRISKSRLKSSNCIKIIKGNRRRANPKTVYRSIREWLVPNREMENKRI